MRHQAGRQRPAFFIFEVHVETEKAIQLSNEIFDVVWKNLRGRQGFDFELDDDVMEELQGDITREIFEVLRGTAQ